MTKTNNLSPRQIVAQLDQYIIGQEDAKKAVAIALRNRYRRGLLDEKLRDEIIPKNILMIGPTGVGKTEIARRIARVVNAPFVKVEATKFTEVGYVGRDVESMIRDLVENAIRMVREERIEGVQEKAAEAANEKLIKLLVPSLKKQSSSKNPFDLLFGGSNQTAEPVEQPSPEEEEIKSKREKIRYMLANQQLEEEIVTIEVEETQSAMLDIIPGADIGQMAGLQDALGSLMPKKKKKRKVTVSKAREILTREEAQKLIDMDDVTQTAVQLTEQNGIVFIDEIDKIASRSGNSSSADVSREGVQRDILPIVEGSTVTTKYGPVKTDFILFIAAGAFHMSKPADLIPELQGRFPIRVELQKLSVDDFYKILVEPDNALLKQYTALLGTEGVVVNFTDEAIRKLAQFAFDVNQDTDNIGARRLHTILEKLLEELSFEAPDIQIGEITITPQYVEEKLGVITKNKDLSRFIL